MALIQEQGMSECRALLNIAGKLDSKAVKAVFEDDDTMSWSGCVVEQLSNKPVNAAYDKLLKGLQGLRNAGIPWDKLRAFAVDALVDVSLENPTEADAAVAGKD
jgi:hypothetical protein